MTPQQLHVSGVGGAGVHHKQPVTDLQVVPEPAGAEDEDEGEDEEIWCNYF